MDQRTNFITTLAIPLVALLSSSCSSAISDPVKLRAVKSEARSLMAHYPTTPPDKWTNVSMSNWPPAIASLKPHSVTVFPWGLDILVRPYLDGGWGYQILRDGRSLPMPANCYSELYQGVFWHGPC
ncbi:MAG TPA: hypothetical protein VF509_05780 [Sphingobium sp.]